MDVKISDNITIPGLEPIVIMGPNGSGKTRHGIVVAGMNDANIIAALRNIELPTNVVMRPMAQAQAELNNHLSRRRSKPWQLSNEIDDLFSKLMAEDSSSAIEFRMRHAANSEATPDTTKLMRLSEAWARLFPGRHIDFTGYNPRVRSDYNIPVGEYSAQQMSDGERVALYLAGRILDSEQKIIIVDEPEVHFHSRLASRFWTELESLRPDCRFLYITHDLPFALSRHSAQFVIIKPNTEPQLVSLKEGVPQDLAESLLAAASFSIHAQRIVFCEGTEGNSRDQMLYSAWFNTTDTALIPVGSGKDVIRCTTAFAESTLVAGVESIGIIDRDYWPQRFIDTLPDSVSILDVHEVENLLCHMDVFISIAQYLGKQLEEAETLYDDFLTSAKAMFSEGLFNKQISERYKRRCEHEFNLALNAVEVSDDTDAVEAQHAQAVKPETWGVNPNELFNQEKTTLENALHGEVSQFMRLYPGKTFFKLAARTIGMEVNAYVNLVCNALKSEGDESLSQLGGAIETHLGGYLPTRSVDQ